jgi:predicted xylose isomerase-like sugar epimerase
MRELFADFARLEERPGLGLSVPLGRVDLSPELADLHNGERVLLVEPGELYAQTIVRPLEAQGYHFWYAVLESRAAIHDLEPGQRPPTQA